MPMGVRQKKQAGLYSLPLAAQKAPFPVMKEDNTALHPYASACPYYTVGTCGRDVGIQMKKGQRIALAAGLLVLAFYLSNQLGLALCAVLDRWSPDFLYEYASEGRFHENVYFSREAEERFGILSDLEPYLDTEEIHSLAGLCEQVAKLQIELIPVIYGNSAYMAYLREKETSIAELFLFCENLDELTENLFFACRYVLFFAWVVALHFLLQCRPLLYFGMGLLCVFASVLRLSNRLFAGIFADGEYFFHFYAEDLIPAMLEAMLTFLIFDITFAAAEKGRISRRLAPLYEELPAVWCIIAFLGRFADSETLYHPRLEKLLPQILAFERQPPRGAKGKRFIKAVGALHGLHTNRTLLRDLVYLQSLLPPQ